MPWPNAQTRTKWADQLHSHMYITGCAQGMCHAGVLA
eukprot:CAMPEP_0174338588 /NCGR_PEP_ID=MMETSP0810-20121108/23255_1 /TAXON_ID=73025 ORGANISM="Eutreptiella gymnastica-like, Strain CCMP1594" /NCGR_SAMPLE_ID=MMETSP0810 /ASSEMBLY_ACC=CAM_ASM_000659 /LENGTH=36 /DNA_ID= /DNA_START= /DNA_END= /DNA_ORIENTATION=